MCVHTITDSKLAVSLCPGRDLGLAIGVREKLQHYIALVVDDTLGELVHEGIVAQIGRSGSDAGQGADNLIVDHITCRGGAGMRVTVRDVCAAAVLASVGHGFMQHLFKAGDASQVFRVQGNAINPAGIAVTGIGAVGGGYGNQNNVISS